MDIASAPDKPETPGPSPPSSQPQRAPDSCIIAEASKPLDCAQSVDLTYATGSTTKVLHPADSLPTPPWSPPFSSSFSKMPSATALNLLLLLQDAIRDYPHPPPTSLSIDYVLPYHNSKVSPPMPAEKLSRWPFLLHHQGPPSAPPPSNASSTTPHHGHCLQPLLFSSPPRPLCHLPCTAFTRSHCGFLSSAPRLIRSPSRSSSPDPQSRGAALLCLHAHTQIVGNLPR